MTSDSPAPTRAAVTIPVKVGYGAGQLVEGVGSAAFSSFLFFFYVGLLGLPGSLVGAAAAISLAVDAVVDPLLGSWSDNIRSRFGRRVPFMVVGGPIVALAVGLIFSPPRGLGAWPLFAWLLSGSLLLRISTSVFNVPFSALGAEVSDDYAERSSVAAYRTVFSILGALAVLILGYGVFLAGSDGLRHIQGYAPMAWSAAALIALGAFVSVLAIHRFAARLPVASQSTVSLRRRLPRETLEMFRNPSFRVLFACTVFFYVGQGVAGALFQHMHLLVWGLTSAQIFQVLLTYFAGLMAATPFAPVLTRTIEKRTLLICGLIMLCLAQGGLSGLRALHVITLSGAAVVGPLCAGAFLAGLGVTVASVSIISMMADAADEHDFLFGARREGLYFAGLSFAGKTATGLGTLIAGIAVDLIGFPTNLATVGTAMKITPERLDALAWVAGPLVALISGTGLLILMLYRIDRRRHVQVSDALTARRMEAFADA